MPRGPLYSRCKQLDARQMCSCPRACLVRRLALAILHTKAFGNTADYADIDPYARLSHASHCGHALIRLQDARGEYRSALW